MASNVVRTTENHCWEADLGEVREGDFPLRDLRDFLNHLALQQQSVRIWTPERVQQDLEQLFDAIQRLTGAQGMGVYDVTTPAPFRLRLVQGERCLGEPDPAWLDAVLKRNQGVWIENSPAEGWNELMIPLPGRAGQKAEFLVRLTGRKLQDQDLLLARTGLHWVYSQILQLRQTIIHQAPVLLNEMLERNGLAGYTWQELNSSEGPLVKTWDNWCRETGASLEKTFDRSATSGQRSQTFQSGFARFPECRFELNMPVWCDSALIPKLVARCSEVLEETLQGWADKFRAQLALSQQIAAHPIIGQATPFTEFRRQASWPNERQTPLLLTGLPGAGKRTLADWYASQVVSSTDHILRLNGAELSQDWQTLEQFLVSSKQESVVVILSGLDLVPPEIQDALAERIAETPCATWISIAREELKHKVQSGDFSEKLALQAATRHFEIPQLSERGQDILLLAQHFLLQSAERTGQAPLTLTDEAQTRLLNYNWPGQVAELEGMMKRFACKRDLAIVSEIDLDPQLFANSDQQTMQDPAGLTEATLDFQRAYIRSAIAEAGGNMTEAARRLGLHRTNFYRKMHQLEMIEARENDEETSTGSD